MAVVGNDRLLGLLFAAAVALWGLSETAGVSTIAGGLLVLLGEYLVRSHD